MPRNRASEVLQPPGYARLLAGFLAIGLPYIAATGLQERFEVAGPAGPLLMVAALAIAWPVSRWLGGSDYPAGAFGLRWRRSTVFLIVGGIAAMAVGRLLVAAVATASGIAAPEAVPAHPALLSAFAMALVIGAVPALAEDILTRGFPLFAARSTRPAATLILLSAALYTLNHLWRFDWGVTEQVRLFCMGIAYAAAALRFRSLWAAFALHLGWNAAGALVPVEIGDVDAFRLLSAALHLCIAAAALTLPQRETR